MVIPRFDLQGHRGARGLRPENTLPSIEAALDVGVTSIEVDLHRTRDGVPIVYHDARISERLCRLAIPGAAPDPELRPSIDSLDLAQLRAYRVERNPDPARFPEQTALPTPLASRFADLHGSHPWAPPTLAELLAFVSAYASTLGVEAGKTDEQRRQAERVRLDLEFKQVPFRQSLDETVDRLGRQVVEVVRAAGAIQRTSIRSFDHRLVRALRRLEPGWTAAVLVYGTAPVSPAQLARQADARVYCPDYEFLDESQVRDLHQQGLRVIPYTVNDPDAWARLLDWCVDGITTDYPDRLAAFLRDRGVAWSGP